ncbi:hypothetical protein DPX16_19420 [Anabarilius grahami]|uniref:Uncharacterized protein n=1 Tax=Anabarilius grahami TaxID=495550 RepID=A0A3N0Z0U0_ANAGA|nr:hypothetical protein DPX16_19420 [Anabarilius grahami]
MHHNSAPSCRAHLMQAVGKRVEALHMFQTNPHGSRSASRAWDGPPERPAARVHVPDSRCTYVSHLSCSTGMEKQRETLGKQSKEEKPVAAVSKQEQITASPLPPPTESRAGGVGAWEEGREGLWGEERRRHWRSAPPTLYRRKVRT